MLKFKDFLKEEYEEVIPVDVKHLMENKDALNEELERLTMKPYQNAPIFLNQLRGCLERFALILPASATKHFLNLGAELIYALGDTDLNLYIVYDTGEDGYVDGYAQIVSPDELDAVLGMDKAEFLNHSEIKQLPSTWYAKREDDGGNSDEY